MASFRIPYQRLHRSGNVLVAARGSAIDSFNLLDGSYLSTWSADSISPVIALALFEESPVATAESSLPPAKRRKLSSTGTEATTLIADDVTVDTAIQQHEDSKRNGETQAKKERKKQNDRADAVKSGFEHPAVICLAATEDGRYVIAVTAEDKSIRVFEHGTNEDGAYKLKQVSVRQMPKRPCAITLSAYSQTIVSADKFGDVYSLPVIPPPEIATEARYVSDTPKPAKPFLPAANELTIHSQRNRRALEQQRRHKTNPKAQDRPIFAGTLILGHVSMLTDLILTTLNGKEYIFTADRDEHIRVTRGSEQTYVIERFCLGHQDIVTRLCIPLSKPEWLISGGGDDDLFFWEWQSGLLLWRVDLKEAAVAVLKSLNEHDGNTETAHETSIVVSSIKHIPCPDLTEDGIVGLVIVTLEGIPAIFVLRYGTDQIPLPAQTFKLAGNPLDVIIDTSSSTLWPRLIISLDTFYKPGSTTERRDLEVPSIRPIEILVVEGGMLVRAEQTFFTVEERIGRAHAVDEEKLTLLLYPLKGLKKREGEDMEG